MVAADGNPDLAQIMAVLADRDDALATLGEDDLVNVYRNYENGLRQAEEYRPGRFRGDIVFFTALQGRTEGSPTGRSNWGPLVEGEIEDYPSTSTTTCSWSRARPPRWAPCWPLDWTNCAAVTERDTDEQPVRGPRRHVRRPRQRRGPALAVAVVRRGPRGWTVAKDEDTRQACLDYINENWTDMRPKSLIEAMGG